MSELPTLPDNLPAIATARLPQAYEVAKQALANCERIDECREWADRMEALASYARQSEDETLLKQCMRIKVRAIDRCGELLRAIPTAQGANQNIEGGASPKVFTRKDAAREAGLSPDQAKTALRVNNVPRELFDDLVESDHPPTVIQLAAIGTKKQPDPPVTIDYLQGRDPADFEQATRFQGLLWHIERNGRDIDLESASRGLSPTEREAAVKLIYNIRFWLNFASEKVDV